MTFRQRITTIYRKELIDILRDRRTLIAMIVVPIVLYPLLMLGSVQAVSYQTETLEVGAIRIGVVGGTQRARLTSLIQRDDYALQQELASRPPNDNRQEQGAEDSSVPRSLIDSELVEFNSRQELETAIHERQIPIGVVLRTSVNGQVEAEILADAEEPRGNIAQRRLADLFDRVNEREKQRKGFVEPYALEFIDLSSPSSILGAVLPLILILMTITGAIYPAIDLTAGERERGTLESLMVCPVRVFDLIVGKFLVVTTVAIMGAALNLSSVTATVYLGGFRQMIGTEGGGLPIGTMLFILLSLIPFAVLMSAIMIAVCSYARTFKEAQNYVTPVILAVLIPGGIAAFPATRLEGLMLVMPVGNMVALAKELLLGATVSPLSVAMVLISTTLYAAAAIAVAAGIFGRESVVFADAGSLRGSMQRRLLKPTDRPSITMGLLLVALLFPAWFFVQSALSPMPDQDARPLLYASAWLMPLMFVGLPLLVMWYWKVNIPTALYLRAPKPFPLTEGGVRGVAVAPLPLIDGRGEGSAVADAGTEHCRDRMSPPSRLPLSSPGRLRDLEGSGTRRPALRHFAAAILIGLSAWVLAHEVNVLQQRIMGTPEAVVRSAEQLGDTLATMSPLLVIFIIALVPAVSEEVLFRGFLLSALARSAGKWLSIAVTAAVFAAFHFFLFRFPVTFGLGLVLAYLCWQSGSLFPSMLAHFLHNFLGVMAILQPKLFERLTGATGATEAQAWAHLPLPVIAIGCVVFTAGILLFRRRPVGSMA